MHAGPRILAWSQRWCARLRRIGERPARLRVAIATCDGLTLNATYEAASSFVLYEWSSSALKYAGLLAWSCADRNGGAESQLRQEILRDLDLVFVLDEVSGRPAAHASSHPRIVRFSVPRPIEELAREFECSLVGSVEH